VQCSGNDQQAELWLLMMLRIGLSGSLQMWLMALPSSQAMPVFEFTGSEVRVFWNNKALFSFCITRFPHLPYKHEQNCKTKSCYKVNWLDKLVTGKVPKSFKKIKFLAFLVKLLQTCFFFISLFGWLVCLFAWFVVSKENSDSMHILNL